LGTFEQLIVTLHTAGTFFGLQHASVRSLSDDLTEINKRGSISIGLVWFFANNSKRQAKM